MVSKSNYINAIKSFKVVNMSLDEIKPNNYILAVETSYTEKDMSDYESEAIFYRHKRIPYVSVVEFKDHYTYYFYGFTDTLNYYFQGNTNSDFYGQEQLDNWLSKQQALYNLYLISTV